MDEGSLVRRFVEADMQLTQDAMEKLRSSKDADVSVNLVLSALKAAESRPFLITGDIISGILEGGSYRPERAAPPQIVPQPEVLDALKSKIEKPPMGISYKKFKPMAAEHESRVKVLKDITGQSFSEGGISDFVGLFRDRYERVGSILKKRLDMNDAVMMSSLRNMLDKQLVKVVGLVKDKRESSAGNVVIELEDLSGTVSAFVFSGNKELLRKAGEVNNDEVVGVVASLKNDGKSPRLFVKDIIWPDLPIRRDIHRAEEPVCAALLSDLHVGSTKFYEGAFLKFIKWIRGESDEPDGELAGRI